jgi:hypothetical protein
MSVCVYSVFLLSFVQVVALRRADRPSKESYRPCKNQETEKLAKVQQRAVEPLISLFCLQLIQHNYTNRCDTSR